MTRPSGRAGTLDEAQGRPYGAADFKRVETDPTRRENRMKIRPLHDKILVKRIEEEEKTKGGIIIPDTAKEKPLEAKVIAVGTGKVLKDGSKRPLAVKEGDRILFGKYTGTEIKIDGEEHLIVSEEEILGVISDK